MRAFLEANVLFSAALAGPAFELLWVLAASSKVDLVTSLACEIEAHQNIERKRPEAAASYRDKLASVEIVGPGEEHLELAATLVAEKDAHVLAAALGASAGVLLTGDVRHFGPLMERSDLPIRCLTLRAFLLDEPPR